MTRVAHCLALMSAALLLSVAACSRGHDAAIVDATAWAYVPLAPGPSPTADPTLRHVPGSTVAMTVAQTRNPFAAPDWRPAEHPPMPDIVSHGRAPAVPACGYCHLPTGRGMPVTAGLAGLPAPYIIEQLANFKNGARKSAMPAGSAEARPNMLMGGLASHLGQTDMTSSAAYFAALRPRAWIKVVETDAVPPTRIEDGVRLAVGGAAKEPVGVRIVEVPAQPARAVLLDPDADFIAYAPRGSVTAGRALAATGDGGRITACTSCHGGDLRGVSAVPPIAGRSPSYIARQLYAFRAGTRRGASSELMRQVAGPLSDADIVHVAAYAASLQP